MVMNPNPAPETPDLNSLKKALLMATYKKSSMMMCSNAVKAGSCDCESCRIDADVSTLAAFVYMAGSMACIGEPALLEEMVDFIDKLQVKYPDGKPVPDKPK